GWRDEIEARQRPRLEHPRLADRRKVATPEGRRLAHLGLLFRRDRHDRMAQEKLAERGHLLAADREHLGHGRRAIEARRRQGLAQRRVGRERARGGLEGALIAREVRSPGLLELRKV